jgi:hypothetical protein
MYKTLPSDGRESSVTTALPVTPTNVKRRNYQNHCCGALIYDLENEIHSVGDQRVEA